MAQRLGHHPQLPLQARRHRGHRLGRSSHRHRHGRLASDGFHPDGTKFERPGRTTVALGRRAVGDAFVATHTHMSLFRGTPDQSYGKFG